MTPIRPSKPSSTARSSPREATDRSLPALLHGAAEPVVVESWFAGWEEPWRALSDAAWDELVRELGGRVQGARVETGANRELATRYGLEILPTVLVFLRGEVVARLTGRVTPARVAATVRAALEHARERGHAEVALEALAAAHESGSPVRSILRRRASPALAHAG